MVEVNRHIDPTLDAAGALSSECFICGKARNHGHLPDRTFGAANPPAFRGFGPASPVDDHDIMPQLGCHGECLEGRSPAQVSYEYHVRLVDVVSLPRFKAREMYGARPVR